MDPIHPIAPGPPLIPRGTRPVERLERISRERDRPARDGQERRRREQPPLPPPPGERDDDDGRPHIDVRV